MPVYRLVVSYDGSGFHGFARQEGLPTVQGRIEEALTRLFTSPIRTSVAGRTDAGVHALGQVVSFQADDERDSADLVRRLNSMCGPEVAVLEAAVAPDGFDARFSAVARTYEYAVLVREVPDPFSRHTTWHHPGRLALGPMREAAAQLLGEHDFTSFGRVEPGKSAVRKIEAIDVDEEGDLVVIRITANSFLQQMVRSIVGTLVAVGEGKIAPAAVGEILEAKDRAKAAAVAPPHGLFLVSVAYPEELAVQQDQGSLAGVGA